jgi:hypothetical protein
MKLWVSVDEIRLFLMISVQHTLTVTYPIRQLGIVDISKANKRADMNNLFLAD